MNQKQNLSPKLKNEMEHKIRSALLSEVYTTPKPGLVDLRDSGAHRDMDVHSFEKSTEAITPYLLRMFELGCQGTSGEEEQVFLAIRKVGMEAEAAMLSATNGVNTHKGMIFTMGIVLAAAGIYYKNDFSHSSGLVPSASENSLCPYEDIIKNENDSLDNRSKNPKIVSEQFSTSTETRPARGSVFPSLASDFKYSIHFGFSLNDTEEILNIATNMCRRTLERDFEEMKKRIPRSHGEKLFHEFGERGIRGQVIDGFPILRGVALPAIRHCYELLRSEHSGNSNELIQASASLIPELPKEQLPGNAAQLNTLLSIIAELNDTNVLSRSNYESMLELREEAKSALSLGGAFRPEGLQSLVKLNQSCIRKNLSPGGAADILAIAILLYSLELPVFPR